MIIREKIKFYVNIKEFNLKKFSKNPHGHIRLLLLLLLLLLLPSTVNIPNDWNVLVLRKRVLF